MAGLTEFVAGEKIFGRPWGYHFYVEDGGGGDARAQKVAGGLASYILGVGVG